MTFLLGQLVNYFSCHSDDAVIRSRKRGPPLGVVFLSTALWYSSSRSRSAMAAERWMSDAASCAETNLLAAATSSANLRAASKVWQFPTVHVVHLA